MFFCYEKALAVRFAIYLDLPNARSLAIDNMETEYLIEDFDSNED